MIGQFLLELGRLIVWLVPVVVGTAALRRLLRSRSFNRLIYFLVVCHALLVLDILWRTAGETALVRAVAHLLCLSPLLLWAVVIDSATATRGDRGTAPPGVPVFRSSRIA